MSSVEMVVFGALWLVLAVLAALVLLLYRQVEKAYRTTTGLENVGLPPGVEAPDVEVMTKDGVMRLTFPSEPDLTMLAFLTPTCSDCLKLVDVLKENHLFPGQILGLVSGEGRGEITDGEDGKFRALWVAHPPDVMRSYGVTTTPLVYILRGRTVLASDSVHSRAGVERLVRNALADDVVSRSAVIVDEASSGESGG
jgi:hypothetical protein